MNHEEQIQKAAALIHPKKMKDGLFADVGCILVSDQGQFYSGVSAATGSNAICAERMAVGAMITGGEYKIKRIVATWKDEAGNIFVIPPCGNCRQFMREVDESNLETEVVMDKNQTVIIKELLPYYDWWKKQE